MTAEPTGALALRPDQELFDDKQLAVLEAMSEGLSKAPKAQQSLFVHYCQASGLDPFSRQIYMISRVTRDGVKWTIQTGIDGYRLIAQRAAAREHAAIAYEDNVWFDADGGEHKVWLSSEPPAAARVCVLKDGRPFPAVAVYTEYVQVKRDGEPNGMWAKMPANQLAKCAEALALRKAFPRDLSGIYTDDEMGQAHNEPLSPEETAARLRKASEQARAAVAAAPPAEPAQDAPAAPRRRPAKKAAAAPPPPAEDIVDAEVVEEPADREAAWLDLVAAAKAASVTRDDVDDLAQTYCHKGTDELTATDCRTLIDVLARAGSHRTEPVSA